MVRCNSRKGSTGKPRVLLPAMQWQLQLDCHFQVPSLEMPLGQNCTDFAGLGPNTRQLARCTETTLARLENSRANNNHSRLHFFADRPGFFSTLQQENPYWQAPMLPVEDGSPKFRRILTKDVLEPRQHTRATPCGPPCSFHCLVTWPAPFF